MKSYSFANVTPLVNGFELSGFPEGDDVIMMDRFNDSANNVVGVDGTMTVNLSMDLSGFIVYKLMQNSESNALLTSLISSQENAILIPVFSQVVNTEGGELASGTQGYITRPAKLNFGGELQFVEWTLVFERLDILNLGVAA